MPYCWRALGSTPPGRSSSISVFIFLANSSQTLLEPVPCRLFALNVALQRRRRVRRTITSLSTLGSTEARSLLSQAFCAVTLIELSVSPRDAGCHVIALSFPDLDDLFFGLTVHTSQFDDLDFRQGCGVCLCLNGESVAKLLPCSFSFKETISLLRGRAPGSLVESLDTAHFSH